MSEEDQEISEMVVQSGVIELDGEQIASIILTETHTTATRARTAANRVLAYIGDVVAKSNVMKIQ